MKTLEAAAAAAELHISQTFQTDHLHRETFLVGSSGKVRHKVLLQLFLPRHTPLRIY